MARPRGIGPLQSPQGPGSSGVVLAIGQGNVERIKLRDSAEQIPFP